MSEQNKYNYQGTCERCGSFFSSNSKRTRFCSMRCAGEYRQAKPRKAANKIKKICPTCGISFETYNKPQKCCSVACSAPLRKKAVSERTEYKHTCWQCRKTFRSRKREQHYCSIDCNGASKQNEEVSLALLQEANEACRLRGSFFGYIYKRGKYARNNIRDAIKKYNFQVYEKPRRKNNIVAADTEKQYVKEVGCVICGEKRSTECAHIVPRTWGGSGKIENIIPLCPLHHKCYDKHLLTKEEIFKLREAVLIKSQIEPFTPTPEISLAA